MDSLYGLSSNPFHPVMSPLQSPEASAGEFLPSAAELEAYMLDVARRVAVGEGALGADITTAGVTASPAVQQQLRPQSPVIQQIIDKCPAAQTMSPPLAIGKVYRADHQVYPLTRAGRAAGEGNDLIGAFYPQSPMAPSPVSPAMAAARAFANNARTGLSVVTWAGLAEPQTPGANFLQQPDVQDLQIGTPGQHLPPPPPPPPRPVLADDPLLRREQLYQEKLRNLEEREKVIIRTIEQLKLDRAYVLGVHADNQAVAKCHAVASKELEDQANLLRRAAQQQQVKEAELEAKGGQLSEAYKALEVAQGQVQQSESALLRQQQDLRKEIEAFDVAQQVKVLLVSQQAKSAAEAAVTSGCPRCAEQAMATGVQDEHACEQTMAEHLRALTISDTSDGAPSPKAIPAPRVILNNRSKGSAMHSSKGAHTTAQHGAHHKKQAAAASINKAFTPKRSGVRVSTPSKGSIKILFREKTDTSLVV